MKNQTEILRLRMNHTRLCSEFLSLLYWAMLAANTIGPGTVVTCARAGAEFDLQVIFPDCVLSSVQLVFCSLIGEMVALPALLCHKEPAQGTQSPLLVTLG